MKDIIKELKEMEKEINETQDKIFQKWADKLDMDIDGLVERYAHYRMDVLKELIEKEKAEEPKQVKVQEESYKS